MLSTRLYITCPPSEASMAERLGAKWDASAKRWYAASRKVYGQLRRWHHYRPNASPTTPSAIGKTPRRQRANGAGEDSAGAQQQQRLGVKRADHELLRVMGAHWDVASQSWRVPEGASADRASFFLRRWPPGAVLPSVKLSSSSSSSKANRPKALLKPPSQSPRRASIAGPPPRSVAVATTTQGCGRFAFLMA